MSFSGVTKLIQGLVEKTTVAATDYFVFGRSDIFKISLANMKKILGIDELNTNFEDITPRIVWAAGVTGAAFRIGKLVHIEGTLSTTGAASYTLCNIPSNLRPVQDIRPLMMCVGSGSDINKTYYGWVRSTGVANAYIVGNNVGVVTFSGTYMLGF